MTAQGWSPRCPRCGARGRAEVFPPANMIFAGRLRPEATKAAGARDRCTKCLTWFAIGPGTEWRINEAGAKKPAPEPFEEEPEEDEGTSADVE